MALSSILLIKVLIFLMLYTGYIYTADNSIRAIPYIIISYIDMARV